MLDMASDPRPTRAALPAHRWPILLGGTLLALCVYYFNYGATFDEGEMQGGNALTMAARVLAVAAIVWALRPYKLRPDSALSLALLYLACAWSLLLSFALLGSLNDSLFVNTLLQLPILVALTATAWHVDHARCFRFMGVVIALQTAGDTVVWLSDASLWISEAFVGGVGNPSSFGLLCSVLCTFFLFHPRAGRARWLLALVLALGAVMSKALFAVLAVAIVSAVWLACSWRRAALGLVAIVVAAAGALTFLAGNADDDTGFIEHKLNAVGALIGLVEYDIDSSATVSLRLEMHQETLAAISKEPLRLIFGHLGGKPYWPMDSQLLTYIGSFGALMLAAFVALHFYWLTQAVRSRRVDGATAAWSLLLFGLIFATNRILDYFPVAMLYFLIVSMALQNGRSQRWMRSGAARAVTGVAVASPARSTP
jgi:hypothetical protein